ncbi:MAG: hypothetical protein U9R52_02590, partial [Candidatus Omnitrophota bacterium]|nr:hypothetical protein [Candidatus Omnitrophota bacterium]
VHELFSHHPASENFDSDTKEKLASTYIFNPVENIKDVNNGSINSPLPHSPVSSKTRLAPLFPWLIVFLMVMLLLANIIYRGKINVKIEVLKESSERFMPAAPGENHFFAEHPAEDIEITGINGSVVEKMGFYGAASSRSIMTKDELLLVNDGTITWASAGFDLGEPIDSTGRSLDFFVKGKAGGESLELILRDADNNSYLPQARHATFHKNMKNEWQFVSVPFSDFDGFYNHERVKHIGFEFGTQTTLNKRGTSIYIRNVKIVKNGKSFTIK